MVAMTSGLTRFSEAISSRHSGYSPAEAQEAAPAEQAEAPAEQPAEPAQEQEAAPVEQPAEQAAPAAQGIEPNSGVYKFSDPESRIHFDFDSKYAAMRNLLYTELGKKVEVLVSYNPKFQYLGEWWKQLYGESEGKDGKGIFPASVNFTTDLHSMGQFIQDGDRIVFETVVNVKESSRSVVIGSDPQNLDQLNYLAGQHVEHCNAMAALGTKIAHIDGGVPQIVISVERIDAATLGEIFYFFEFACGVSAYLLGVNPFNQPGVEAYKKNMFALLEKPGYEERTAELRARI